MGKLKDVYFYIHSTFFVICTFHELFEDNLYVSNMMPYWCYISEPFQRIKLFRLCLTLQLFSVVFTTQHHNIHILLVRHNGSMGIVGFWCPWRNPLYLLWGKYVKHVEVLYDMWHLKQSCWCVYKYNHHLIYTKYSIQSNKEKISKSILALIISEIQLCIYT